MNCNLRNRVIYSGEEFCFGNDLGRLNMFFKSYNIPCNLFLTVFFFVDFTPLADNKTDGWSSCSEILKQNRLVNYGFLVKLIRIYHTSFLNKLLVSGIQLYVSKFYFVLLELINNSISLNKGNRKRDAVWISDLSSMFLRLLFLRFVLNFSFD